MNQHRPKQRTLVTVHGYAGDKTQMDILRPVHEHHQLPIVYITPTDSPVLEMGPHICRTGGKRAYTGQLSLDRQYEHFKIMLEYDFDFYLANDSDSFVLSPEIPKYVYDHPDTFFSNQVSDFRKPGQSWNGQAPWPKDYHKGFPLIAMQPPYFFSRSVLKRFVDQCGDIKACPICPFIDWYMVQCCYKAHVKHAGFTNGVSCGTTDQNGRNAMAHGIRERGSVFLHSVKTQDALDVCINAYNSKK